MTPIRFASARLLWVGLASTALLSACHSNTGAGTDTAQNTGGSTSATMGSSGGKRIKIGFANLTEDIPFAVRVREGIEEASKKAGNIDLVTADNKLDGATALANADNFITQGVQGVVEFQTDEKFGKSIMDKFKAKGIPVIAIDIPMPGATFFGVNNPLAGGMAGKGLGEWIKKNWNGQVDALVMLELPQSGPVPAARMKGQRDGLEAIVGKIPESKVKHLDSKNTLEEARKLMSDTLTTLPNAKHIAVVCINDDTAAGAIALRKRRGAKPTSRFRALTRANGVVKRFANPAAHKSAQRPPFPKNTARKSFPCWSKPSTAKKCPRSFILLTPF